MGWLKRTLDLSKTTFLSQVFTPLLFLPPSVPSAQSDVLCEDLRPSLLPGGLQRRVHADLDGRHRHGDRRAQPLLTSLILWLWNPRVGPLSSGQCGSRSPRWKVGWEETSGGCGPRLRNLWEENCYWSSWKHPSAHWLPVTGRFHLLSLTSPCWPQWSITGLVWTTLQQRVDTLTATLLQGNAPKDRSIVVQDFLLVFFFILSSVSATLSTSCIFVFRNYMFMN